MVREILKARTENGKVFDLGNGKRRLESYIGARHWKDDYSDPTEAWKDIDLTWEGNSITKAPYELIRDGNKLTFKDKKTGEVSTIELVSVKPAGIPFEIIPEFSAVRFQHILPTDKIPFEAQFKVTGKAPITRAWDNEGELGLDTAFKDGVLTSKLSEVKDKLTGLARVAKGSIRIDPTWQVVASTDDCRRTLGAVPAFSLTVYLWAGTWYIPAEQCWYGNGMRFTNITIPHGATITGAYLTLRCIDPRSTTVMRTRISAEDVDDAPTFVNDGAAFDARWANRTTARVDWDDIPEWTLDTEYNSPEIKTVIQEVIDRALWASGNDIVIFWEDFENRSDAYNLRGAYSYDDSTPYAPKLVVTYTMPAPTASTQDATGITSIAAILNGTIEALNDGNCDERGFDWGKPGQYKISAGATPHSDYGLAYPVTYKFNIPAASANLTAWARKGATGVLTQLTEKTTADFFNGIECVRFDYANNCAYVSVAFGADDDIYIIIRDTSGDLVPITFIAICAYYDNRKAVVVMSADDGSGGQSQTELDAIDACRTRGIWVTDGVAIFYGILWANLQPRLDLGFLEIASHSYNHQELPYTDYDLEIGGSRDEIILQLNLPAIYKKGASEFVPAWSEPYGSSDATARAKLGVYKYLVDRSGTEDVYTFPTWDAVNGLYNRVGYSLRLENETEAALNSAFDAAYTAGQIYHLMCHPSLNNWSPGQKALNHLDHIKNKLDVWYVGFGALYMYHYAQERGEVTVTEPTYGSAWTETDSFGVGAFSHQITGLTPSTGYIFRAKAHNANGWGYGEDEYFITSSPATATKSASLAAKLVAAGVI